MFGIQEALTQAAKAAGIQLSDISLIRINEATPVIGDVAMETITETIITESTMIGHNPKTPGGVGLGVGITITPEALLSCSADTPYILVVSSAFDFADVAAMVNAATAAGYQITGIILQQDDGVLVNNRLQQPLPVIDEVQHIDRIPLGMLAAVEVALPGKIIETLSKPLRYCDRFRSQRRGDQKYRANGTGADWQPLGRGGENPLRRRQGPRYSGR
ncbi:Diol dehydratase-reactivating factor large subunit [Serratia liquefaciens]|nr:Diol dehydratase-reactivating factor large subunit [Serratia liquefaciens]